MVNWTSMHVLCYQFPLMQPYIMPVTQPTELHPHGNLPSFYLIPFPQTHNLELPAGLG